MTPGAWANKFGGDVDKDEEGQTIIYLSKEEYPSDRDIKRKLPPRWDYEDTYDGTSWVVYTNEYPGGRSDPHAIREELSADDAIAMSRESDRRLGLPDEGPHEALITALQGTFLGSPPREMGAAAWAKVGEYYPDEAKELMAMSPNKLDNLIAMAWPTGY
jgi:hypothetical protein